jgi:hypothetical protein
MLNPQSLKVNVNVYLLRAQQIFRTAQAILTRNGLMNHHVQRELTMAEKRMYGDLKLFIQNASKSGKTEVLQTCWRTEMQRLGICASLL